MRGILDITFSAFVLTSCKFQKFTCNESLTLKLVTRDDRSLVDLEMTEAVGEVDGGGGK